VARKEIFAVLAVIIMVGTVFGSMVYENKGNDINNNESDTILKNQADTDEVLKPLTNLSEESSEFKSSSLNKSTFLKNTAEVTLSGHTLYVGGSGPNNYSKIQYAIDNASSGDTIFVYNGTYYENVIINKSISLVGQDRDGVIINGSGSGDGIYINESSWVNISNLTVTDSGNAVGDGGIDIYHSRYVNVENVNVSGNGVGIYIQYSSSGVIHANIIKDSKEKGILMVSADIPGYYSDNNRIYRNTISNNPGGGIDIELYSENNFIYDNLCNNNGYDGIYIKGNNNLINNNTYSNNDRYGIYLLSDSNNITNNTCNWNGIRGIYLEGADYNYIYNNTCCHNQYGIYINLASSNNNISSNTCNDNTEAGVYTKEANNNIIWGQYMSIK